MAPSFLEKINTLIGANLHGIVDRALESRSVRVMDEYIRQAERNLDALEDSAATVGGTVKTLKRKHDELAASAEALDRDIDSLILNGREDLASAAQARLNTRQELAADYYEQWQEQERQYNMMLDMRAKLVARLTTIRQERERLIALIELTEARKVATRTIRSLDQLAHSGDTQITDLAERIRSNLDREDARLEMATANLGGRIDDAIGNAEVDRQLEERRKRLGIQQDEDEATGRMSAGD
ncbi:MAG: PspA/IM30 family protein [Anaerolineaceae bacterium]|nr:PspA/IM30 family protein [Anaerolineaceae bacterium]MDE0328573.1 PspA/IM30 family protein [Anaerolineaceae bacterium]